MQKQCYLVLVVCIACSTQEENTVVTASHPQQNKAQEVDNSHGQSRLTDTLTSEAPDRFLTPEKFKVAKLDTFRIGQVDKLVQLTPAEERQYLQQPIVHSIYKPYHFYSLQENTAARKEITVLFDDGEYKLDLLRLVYNKQNKLVSKQVVAFAASDGDVSDDAYGWFETPALFHLVEVRKAQCAKRRIRQNMPWILV
jgi:hypothetical protein